MSESDKRIAEIAEDAANGAIGNEREFVYAIREALSDPVIRQQIENEALEHAAKVCEQYVDANDGIESAEDTRQVTVAIAAAIRALKG